MKGPGCDGAPLSSTAARVAVVKSERLDAAKARLNTARRVRRQADLTGDVTEEMLEDIVAAEDAVARLEGRG
jgi:hypothetical protein